MKKSHNICDIFYHSRLDSNNRLNNLAHGKKNPICKMSFILFAAIDMPKFFIYGKENKIKYLQNFSKNRGANFSIHYDVFSNTSKSPPTSALDKTSKSTRIKLTLRS